MTPEPNSRRLVNDEGELLKINNFLAQNTSAEQNRLSLQHESEVKKDLLRQKMWHIIYGFQEIDRGLDEKIMYLFNDSLSAAAIVINFPFINVENGNINIRYLAATTQGFGYLSFSFDKVIKSAQDTIFSIEIPLNSAYSDIDKIYALAPTPSENNKSLDIDNLRILNDYFDKINGNLGEGKPGTLDQLTEDEMGLVFKNSWELRNSRLPINFSLAQKFDVAIDLQTVLDKLTKVKQAQINEANISVDEATNRLNLANDSLEILGRKEELEPRISEVETDKPKKKKRFVLF
ncbi:MAG TPA: hypothetical protein VG895_00895 [Patescibacteria group bacterium]|nr:hypothetical protein [Patescibacteria group bacterium]